MTKPYYWAIAISVLVMALSTWAITTWAQQVYDPAPLAIACAYNSSPPTAMPNTFIYIQCTSTNQLSVQ